MNRFKFLQIVILLTSIILHTGRAEAETLYVFFPSALSAASVQKKLGKGWPGIKLMVFGRFRDFQDRVTQDMPDAILSKPRVIESIGGYTVKLNAVRKGKTRETYILLSAGTQMEINRISDLTIGVFDILGRKGMKKFVEKYINPVPRLRRVSKMEDLLQMLTFNMVDSILIPEHHAAYYKKISELHFTITPLKHMEAGILALGIKKGRDTDLIVKTLTASDKQYLELLEVEQWK